MCFNGPVNNPHNAATGLICPLMNEDLKINASMNLSLIFITNVAHLYDVSENSNHDNKKKVV